MLLSISRDFLSQVMRHELISTAVHLSLASALAEPPHLCAVSRPLCFVSHSSNGACHAPWPKPQGRCSLQVVSCVHDGSIYNFQKKAVPAQAAGLPSHHTVPGVTMTSVWVWALLLPSVCRLLFLSELQFLYMIMEVEKSHNLPSANWRPRKVG